MSYQLITPPAEEPVTLAEAKLHLRVDSADDDALIGALIVAARQQAEHLTGRALCTQTWDVILDAFPEAFKLSYPPVQSVVEVVYLDSDGASQSLTLADTLLDKTSTPGYLVPAYGKAWPESYCVPNAVRVRYVCGYGTAADVPPGIKAWMLLSVGTLYAQRESFVVGQAMPLPDRFWQGLLDPFRVYDYL